MNNVPRRVSSGARSLVSFGCLHTPSQPVSLVDPALDPKLAPPANFELEGEPFCFAGANNYYLTCAKDI